MTDRDVMCFVNRKERRVTLVAFHLWIHWSPPSTTGLSWARPYCSPPNKSTWLVYCGDWCCHTAKARPQIILLPAPWCEEEFFPLFDDEQKLQGQPPFLFFSTWSANWGRRGRSNCFGFRRKLFSELFKWTHYKNLSWIGTFELI